MTISLTLSKQEPYCTNVINMTLSNKMVLIEQYADDRGSGQGIKWQSPPEAETHLASGHSMEAANLPAY